MLDPHYGFSNGPSSYIIASEVGSTCLVRMIAETLYDIPLPPVSGESLGKCSNLHINQQH